MWFYTRTRSHISERKIQESRDRTTETFPPHSSSAGASMLRSLNFSRTHTLRVLTFKSATAKSCVHIFCVTTNMTHNERWVSRVESVTSPPHGNFGRCGVQLNRPFNFVNRLLKERNGQSLRLFCLLATKENNIRFYYTYLFNTCCPSECWWQTGDGWGSIRTEAEG